MLYDSPSQIRKLLNEHEIALKKRFGQNFLVNRNARERIKALLEIGEGDVVWEIGPGLGAMTEPLAERARRLVVFEIDHGLVRILNEFFGARSNVTIVPGDAVKTIQQLAREGERPDRLSGNLPYASASRIIAALIDSEIIPRKTVFTVQKELAGRMTARPRHKNYSSFSVLCQSAFQVTHEFDLAGGNFYPEPEVISSVVTLVPRPLLSPETRRRFNALIRICFTSRRKTLKNNLLKTTLLNAEEKRRVQEYLRGREIGENARAEELAVEVYVAIAKLLAGEKQAD